jgi:hypothetical protein
VLAPTSAEIIIAALEELKAKAKKWNANPDEIDLPNALYAARELQKFVNWQRSDVANESAARIYVDALRTLVAELDRSLPWDLSVIGHHRGVSCFPC